MITKHFQVLNCIWICKVKANQELIVLNYFHCFSPKSCSSTINYLGIGKKTGKPVGTETHLKIKCFWLHVSVTDQQKGNNAAHFIFPAKGNKPSYDPKNAFSVVCCSNFARFSWLRHCFLYLCSLHSKVNHLLTGLKVLFDHVDRSCTNICLYLEF